MRIQKYKIWAISEKGNAHFFSRSVVIKKFIGCDNQILEFEAIGQTTNAEECKIYKELKNKEISRIVEMQKDLETNEDLPCIASYKKGYNKGKEAKILALTN